MAVVIGTNSYVTEAECTTYFGDRFEGDEWDAADLATKEGSLVSAADMLERQKWQGERFQPRVTNTMDWPRTGLKDQEGEDIVPVDELDFPQFVMDAQCQLALDIIKKPAVLDAADTSNNIKRLKADVAEIEYFDTSRASSGTRFPVMVHELIGEYLEANADFKGPFFSDTAAVSGLKDYKVNGGI